MVKVLHQEQIPVSVTNPARVRAAAQAQGQRAKTDRARLSSSLTIYQLKG